MLGEEGGRLGVPSSISNFNKWKKNSVNLGELPNIRFL